MWPRVAELILAGWLAASPFVLGHINGPAKLAINDFACAASIAVCALGSFAPRARRLHLFELPIAAWMLAFGYTASPEPLAALQNNILTALVLMMFAIIPSQADRPPRAWRDFERSPGSSPTNQ